MVGIRSSVAVLILLGIGSVEAQSSKYRGFPYGEPCSQLACSAQPWQLTWTSFRVSAPGRSVACFRLSKKSCSPPSGSTKKDCCKTFSSLIGKIDLSTREACRGKVARVTLSAPGSGPAKQLKKVEVVAFRNQKSGKTFAEVRLWDVNLTAEAALKTTVCLELVAPCDSLKTFCVNPDSPGGSECQYAILDVYDGHHCCPTCPSAGFVRG
jgi:hypothetical protein